MKDKLITMNPQHPLTKAANTRLILALQNFGNTLNIGHKMALCALNDSMTSMAEGSLQGRWAFGLPTGTGKTRAIVEWITAVYEAKLPYSVAVAASRVEALCTLKKDLMANGVPEHLIGLLHEGAKRQYSLEATTDNDSRPFLLCSHQMIRADEENLNRYNTYQGEARSLLLYDESLLIADVDHVKWRDLKAGLLWGAAYYENDAVYHKLADYCQASVIIMQRVFDTFDHADTSTQMIELPRIDPAEVDRFCRTLKNQSAGDLSTVLYFLKLANSPLRMLRDGDSAIVRYDIVVPPALKNIIILDASYPIRKLCLSNQSVQDAETLPSLKGTGVPSFQSIKRFDRVTIQRLRTSGSRTKVELDFKADKRIAREVAEVVKTIPPDEGCLLFVYKQQKNNQVHHRRVVERVLTEAGIDLDATLPNGRLRIEIETFGNETSLNCYNYMKHVFLVGVLHRDAKQLSGQYLGEIDTLSGEVERSLREELVLSERAHLVYQALSRGTCRISDNGQALPMTGYVVEVDPDIEDTISTVMNGVTWSVWKPQFVTETGALINTWVEKVKAYLGELEDDRISSQTLKKAIHAEKVHPSTWKLIIQAVIKLVSPPKKEDYLGDCLTFAWKLEGRSLVKMNAKYFGLRTEDDAA